MKGTDVETDYFDRGLIFSPLPSKAFFLSLCVDELSLFTMKSKEEQQEIIPEGKRRHLGRNTHTHTHTPSEAVGTEMVTDRVHPDLLTCAGPSDYRRGQGGGCYFCKAVCYLSLTENSLQSPDPLAGKNKRADMFD